MGSPANYKTPSEGIKDLIVTAQLGFFPPDAGDIHTTGWQIEIGRVIESPDQLISIRDTGGKTPNPKWNIDYPSVQVRIRGAVNGYVTARTKARMVKDILVGLPSQDLNGDRWTAIFGIGDIQDLGYDVNNRPQFVLNLSLIIEPVNAGNREKP